MFSNLKIGTKIVGVVISIVMLGIIILASIFSIQASNILHTEADKLLQINAFRYANIVRGATESVYSTLLGVEDTIKNTISNENSIDDTEVQNILEGVLDSNEKIAYMYVHFFNTPINQNTNPKLLTNQHKFLMLLHDTSLKTEGGVQLVQAYDAFLQQQSINNAISTQKESIGKPQIFNINGEEIFAYNIVIPIFKNGNIIGVVGALGSLTHFRGELTDPKRSIFKDDQRLLLGAEGLIAVSPVSKFTGKSISEANPHPSAKTLIQLQKDKINTVFDFTRASDGKKNRAAIATFDLWDNSQDAWSIVTMAPVDSIQMPITKLITTIAFISLFVILVIVIIVFIYINKAVSSRIVNLQNNLLHFFKFINHETKDTILSKDTKSNDELSIM
ncbi:hypothetical protein, partial [Campylobacter sp. IFREMER_LSEM_CL1085]